MGRVTIGKELTTLRVVWGWATGQNLALPPQWSRREITLPKATQRPPFQTYDQIRDRITRGGLAREQILDLWECLWLDQAQTLEVLGGSGSTRGNP